MLLKTLDNALEILEMFTEENPTWGVRELARELEMSHTVVNRVLYTFEKKNYLIQDKLTKKYSLGLKILEHSKNITKNFNLIEEVKPLISDLKEEVGESVFFTWKEDCEGVVLAVSESAQQVKFSVTVGSRTPLFLGASCKVIYSYLDSEEKYRVERKYKDELIISEDWKKETRDIINQGYCETFGEFDKQTFGISVPLFNKLNNVVGSITIAGPKYRYERVNRSFAISKLLSTSKIINNLIRLSN